MTLDEYLNLTGSAFRNKPKFISTVSTSVSPFVAVGDVLDAMIPAFDVDFAVGTQLDIIGQWVGVSRQISVPISGVYFSWDSTPSLGWDSGSWQPSDLPAQVTSLPDENYRTVIKAKIAANKWDGTKEKAYEIWDQIFSTIQILISDNQDMTISYAFFGGIIDALTIQLILQGYIPLKPAGVKLREIFVPYDSGPIFAWDCDSTQLKGWDQGAWATIYAS